MAEQGDVIACVGDGATDGVGVIDTIGVAVGVGTGVGVVIGTFFDGAKQPPLITATRMISGNTAARRDDCMVGISTHEYERMVVCENRSPVKKPVLVRRMHGFAEGIRGWVAEIH